MVRVFSRETAPTTAIVAWLAPLKLSAVNQIPLVDFLTETLGVTDVEELAGLEAKNLDTAELLVPWAKLTEFRQMLGRVAA